MATHPIQIPQLGETVSEAIVVAWLKQPGDAITANEPLLEIATDKVDTEVPSTVDGVVLRLLVEEGTVVDVGTVVAEIETTGAADGDDERSTAPAAVASVPAAGQHDGQGPAGARGRHPSELVSPLVRRLVAEHNIDLEELRAFAGGVRVSRGVVERFLTDRPSPPAAASMQAARPAQVPEAAGETVPFSRIRARTAEHMVQSVHTSPHVLTAMEVDFERVARLRRERRADVATRFGAPLTYLAFVATAVVRCLGDARRLNAQVVEGGLHLHADINLGIAVDLEGEGLVVPVIRQAGRFTLPAMAKAIADAAERARAGRVSPDDLTGGTFTISSQGPYGTLLTGAIINQPQVAILSVDGIRKRPVVVEYEGDDLVVAHHTGVLGLSWDHRAIDGLYAARFLATVRDRIEQSDWAAELGGP